LKFLGAGKNPRFFFQKTHEISLKETS